MECNGNDIDTNAMEWNGMEWNGMEWNGMGGSEDGLRRRLQFERRPFLQ
jgi:hypothetical protein